MNTGYYSKRIQIEVCACALLLVSCSAPRHWPRRTERSNPIYSVAARDSELVWTSAPNGRSIIRVYRERFPFPEEISSVELVNFRDHTSVIAVGQRGAIFNRIPAGGWRRLRSPTTHDLNAITYAGPGRSQYSAFAVGRAGTVIHMDGDGTWEEEDSHTSEDLRDVVECRGRGSMLACGQRGVVLERLESQQRGEWRMIGRRTDRNWVGVRCQMSDVWTVDAYGSMMFCRGDSLGQSECRDCVAPANGHYHDMVPVLEWDRRSPSRYDAYSLYLFSESGRSLRSTPITNFRCPAWAESPRTGGASPSLVEPLEVLEMFRSNVDQFGSCMNNSCSVMMRNSFLLVGRRGLVLFGIETLIPNGASHE